MTSDQAVLLAVLATRLVVPLFIPRFPLPAILASLVIDAADQSIFQAATDLDLAGYQGYDKALDVYYLAIAFLSTMRNWRSPYAALLAAGLWYYRLIGVTLFELTDVRALLLVFPNTFEYLFIAYETIRLGWDPNRLGRRRLVLLAAFIWVFIKLPQEWWIHIAKLDFTNVLKRDVLGVPLDASWGTALGENWWFVALVAVLAVALVLAVRAVVARAPAPDWPVSFDVDRHPGFPPTGHLQRTRFFDMVLAEKVVLIVLVVLIFAQMLPESSVATGPLCLAVAVISIGNAAVSEWWQRRGATWATIPRQFVAMLVLNLGLVGLYAVLPHQQDRRLNEAAAAFFLLLVTLIITLYDRYRPLRATRVESAV
ncbi:MAG: hypothetical protein ACK5OX_13045 [Desertimonas sp.]